MWALKLPLLVNNIIRIVNQWNVFCFFVWICCFIWYWLFNKVITSQHVNIFNELLTLGVCVRQLHGLECPLLCDGTGTAGLDHWACVADIHTQTGCLVDECLVLERCIDWGIIVFYNTTRYTILFSSFFKWKKVQKDVCAKLTK